LLDSCSVGAPARHDEGHAMVDEAVIREHYRRLGPNYNALLRYSPDFVPTLTAKMVDELRLHPDDQLVDLGCGTGMYAADILRRVPLRKSVIGVEPFAEMLAHIPDDVDILPVQADALEFSERPGTYDKVLIKETIHHVADRPRLFANLHERLTAGGIVLLVHVPPNVQYPLFEAALERCLTWMTPPDELVTQLEQAGFTVERDAVDYQHTIPKERYFEMVSHRYMSVLTSFTPDELEAGLEEMARTYADVEDLTFVDHFDYLTATKP
jgi:trans-aconitate methyltransferase